jgi:hypothetical protein
MKKIPCLFVREFEGGAPKITSVVTPGCEWVMGGYGIATRKYDGTACMVKDGRLYKRYDAKRGKPAPVNGIPCGDPDPVTGHHPFWIPVGDEPESKWHKVAWEQAPTLSDGTYELCGPHFQTNPEGFHMDIFITHGRWVIEDLDRTFEGLRSYLTDNPFEGVVFWLDGEPRCKIRRGDFGLPWPVKP